MAIALSIPFAFNPTETTDSWFWPALAFLAQIEIAVLILNLLPIPALDGYGILEPWLPEKMQQQLKGFKKYGFIFLIAMFWTSPTFSGWFWGMSLGLAQQLGVPRQLSTLGYAEFLSYRWALLLVLIGWAIIHKRLSPSQSSESPESKAEAVKLQQELNQSKLAQQPKNYGALNDQGKLLMREQHYEKAVAHYSVALAHYPNDARFWMERGFAYARQQNFEAALADYEQSLKLRPRERETLHVKADALLMLERYDQSLEVFDQVVRYYPNYEHLWYDRGLVLQRLGRDRDALASYEKALKIDPKDDHHWSAVIALQQELGEVETAERLLKRGIKQHPKSLRLWQFKLNQAMESKQYEAVLSLCDRCEQWTESDDPLPAVGRAIALGALQRFDKAKQAIDRALELEPGSNWILRNRIQLLTSMKCYDDARTDLALLLAEDPQNAKLLEREAGLLISLDKPTEAIAIYDQLLTQEQTEQGKPLSGTTSTDAEPEVTSADQSASQRKRQVRYQLNKGLALFHLEQYAAALDCYEQALAIAPEDPHGLANRGAVRIKLDQQQAGLGDLDKAVFLEPDNAQLWKTRGDALYAKGQWKRALASYNQGLALGVDIELLCDRASCYLALEDNDAAITALQTTQALDASTTDRVVLEKPSLAELWQSLNASTTSEEATVNEDAIAQTPE